MIKTLKDVVSERLGELGRNPFEAARAGSLERSYINDILIEKKTSVRDNKMAGIAKALDWGVGDLLSALGRDVQITKVGSTLSVQGRIGAGQQILPDFEQLGPDGLYQIEVLLDLPDDAIAFEVSGESMWPRYDEGDIIVCWNRTVDANTMLGWEAAVKTSDGRRFLKRVIQGDAPDLFTLESHNAKPIANVRLDWISPVEHVVRAGRWAKLSQNERASQIRKAVSHEKARRKAKS